MSATPESKPAVSKPLLYTLAGVAVLALGLFIVMPLLSGDDAVAEDGPVAAAPTPEPTVEPTVEPEEELPPVGETFEVFSARDPFEQLVSDEVAEDVAVVGGEPASDEEPVVIDPSEAPPASTTEGGTTVVVDDVFLDGDTDMVLLTVNGTAHTLGVGDVFATNWRVEALDEPCVTLLYGDQARLVCEGESIRK